MRLRRKAAPEAVETADDAAEAPDVLAAGPLDADDLDLDEDPAFASHVDLGGLLVAPPPEGIDLRLQVDEATDEVIAVLLAGPDGALELRVFAAGRNSEIWADVRRSIAAETTRHGGTTSERSGAWGTELLTQLPVTAPDGSSAIQPSRIIGVTGARWFLRATMLGRPAVEADDAEMWEDMVRSTIVRRGAGAMPPGEAIELVLPHVDPA